MKDVAQATQEDMDDEAAQLPLEYGALSCFEIDYIFFVHLLF